MTGTSSFPVRLSPPALSTSEQTPRQRAARAAVRRPAGLPPRTGLRPAGCPPPQARGLLVGKLLFHAQGPHSSFSVTAQLTQPLALKEFVNRQVSAPSSPGTCRICSAWV